MKRRIYPKFLISLFAILLLIFCAGCETNTPAIKPGILTSISINEGDNNQEYVIETFNIEEVDLFLHYSNNTKTTESLTKDMISDSDYLLLNTIGRHEITINYLDLQTTFIVTIVKKQEVENRDVALSILEVNDLHGYIEQDEQNYNGFSNTAYLINSIRNETPEDDVLLIGNGDLFQGTAISNLTQGLAIIECMNAMDFDLMGIGNHEFDWGLPTILKYFDGNQDNGEADFPLLNGNIYLSSSDEIVTIEEGNIFSSTIIEKDGIKVGVISFIGDVSTSINYAMYKPYEIKTNISQLALNIGSSLKDQGADVIVVNIHGGNSSSVNNYDYNNDLANLKYKGEYLVDAIINGHTHTAQRGYIERSSGIRVPVIQAGANNSCLGRINLTINTTTKEISSNEAYYIYVDTVKDYFVTEVETIITDFATSVGNEVYSVAKETVNYTSELYPWAGNVLRVAVGADVSIANKGGLRSNGDLINGENVTVNNLYSINPFNNSVFLITLTGDEIYDFIDQNSVYYSLANGMSLYSLNGSTEEYTVAVIDYVYYWESFPINESGLDTNLKYTDLMIMDVKLHEYFKPVSEPDALITNQLNKN